MFTPFKLRCETCSLELRVTREELLGQILPCPQCRSMVLVKEPTPEPPEPAEDQASVERPHVEPPSESGLQRWVVLVCVVIALTLATGWFWWPPGEAIAPADQDVGEKQAAAEEVSPQQRRESLPERVAPPAVVEKGEAESSDPGEESTTEDQPLIPVVDGPNDSAPLVESEVEIQPTDENQPEGPPSAGPDNGTTQPEQPRPAWEEDADEDDGEDQDGDSALAVVEAAEEDDLGRSPVLYPAQHLAEDAAEIGPDDPLGRVEITGAPWVRAIEACGQLAGMPIAVDPLVWRLGYAQPGEKVTLTQPQATLRSLLAELATDRGLQLRRGRGCLRIVVPKVEPETKPYRVANLLADGSAEVKSKLSEVLASCVLPREWQGGRAQARWEDETLLVTGSPALHADLAEFFARWRFAREGGDSIVAKPLPLSPARVEAESFSLTVMRPTDFSRAMAFLGDQIERELVIDWWALANRRISPGTQVTFAVVEQPPQQAMRQLLPPLGLTSRAIDGETILITTTSAVRHRPLVRFFRVPPGQSAATVAAKVRKKLGDGAQSKVLADDPAGLLILAVDDAEAHALGTVLDDGNRPAGDSPATQAVETESAASTSR